MLKDSRHLARPVAAVPNGELRWSHKLAPQRLLSLPHSKWILGESTLDLSQNDFTREMPPEGIKGQSKNHENWRHI
jgi:hypothetical protein